MKLFICFIMLLLAGMVCEAQTIKAGFYRSSLVLPGEDDSTPDLLQHVPASGIAEAITPQIQALADGLQDDPEQIFNYVHDHIHFVLYFGSKKGAQLTLLEKSGNDFDQCALLVALLRAAGYSNAQYEFGWEELPYDDPSGQNYDLHHWWQLTLNNTNWTTTWNYLQDLIGVRGYPHCSEAGDGNDIYLQRSWVAVTVDSVDYLGYSRVFMANRDGKWVGI